MWANEDFLIFREVGDILSDVL